jgi:hypothetical protein
MIRHILEVENPKFDVMMFVIRCILNCPEAGFSKPWGLAPRPGGIYQQPSSAL